MTTPEDNGRHVSESEEQDRPVVDLSGAVGQRAPESVIPGGIQDEAPSIGAPSDETTVQPDGVPYVNPPVGE